MILTNNSLAHLKKKLKDIHRCHSQNFVTENSNNCSPASGIERATSCTAFAFTTAVPLRQLIIRYVHFHNICFLFVNNLLIIFKEAIINEINRQTQVRSAIIWGCDNLRVHCGVNGVLPVYVALNPAMELTCYWYCKKDEWRCGFDGRLRQSYFFRILTKLLS